MGTRQLQKLAVDQLAPQESEEDESSEGEQSPVAKPGNPFGMLVRCCAAVQHGFCAPAAGCALLLLRSDSHDVWRSIGLFIL